MAHMLRLSWGPSPGLTMSLSDNVTAMLVSYTPKAPDIASTPQSDNNDGGELSNIRYNNVTETIELLLIGGTTAMVDTVHNIELRLLEARRFQKNRTGTKVFLEFKTDSDSFVWRSEILAGRLELDKDALAIWGNGMIRANLIITRRFFWERDLVAVRISTLTLPSPSTTGRSISNNPTSGNYAQVAGTEIVGFLPAPAKIELRNDTNGTQSYRNIHLANNAYGTSTLFSHIIEGESSTVGTQVLSGTCSGGRYMQSTFSGSTFFLWQLSTSQLLYAGGRTFRLLARFVTYPVSASVYVRPVLANEAGLIPVAEGDEVRLPNDGTNIRELVDLGNLALPPNGNGLAWDAMTLKLNMRSSTSVTVGLDYIQLTPTEEYRHLVMRGGQLIADGTIVDDGIEQQTYLVESGSNKPYFSPRGDYIYLHPGITQRIYIVHDEGQVSDIQNAFGVKLWYRPRRLTI